MDIYFKIQHLLTTLWYFFEDYNALHCNVLTFMFIFEAETKILP